MCASRRNCCGSRRFTKTCCGWHGTLIEANPANFHKLNNRGRLGHKVHMGVCSQPGTMNISAQGAVFATASNYHATRKEVKHGGTAEVPCDTLSSILDATLGVGTRVDFLSLDVQGAELMVLKSIDWTVTTIGVLIAECKGLGCGDVQDAAVRTLLESTAGLQWHGVLRARHDVWDAVYTNRSLATEAVASR